jgi:hypothetical protein
MLHAACLRERTPLHSTAELSTSPSTTLSGAASPRCHRCAYAVLASLPCIDPSASLPIVAAPPQPSTGTPPPLSAAAQ